MPSSSNKRVKRIQNESILTNGSKKSKLDYSILKPSQTLYIKNLNNKINKQLLKENLYLLFINFGDLIDVKLYNGFAFIIYSNVDSSILAMKSLQNEEFFSKKLIINYATKESKIITYAKKTNDETNDDEDDDDDAMPTYE
ncbi:unnamed protein product [Candida verbasci]|uniref:RRM domain-containing protein n=1 Tax=Candida verbasci TaxID=1227364 RepID=A0A9W4XFM1_9ASCO|nr:unnamed protein product [Candida verbasci]